MPESVIIVDNLVVHKCPILMEIIRSQGVHYIFLPPYSPFFNPIEECFGFVKYACRHYNEEYQDKPIHEAIHDAFQRVTVPMIQGFFKHAGYE